MNVSESQRKSSQLLDQLVHDAKIVKKSDEHISGSPTAPTGDQVFRHAAEPKLPWSAADNRRLSYDNDAACIGLAKAFYGSGAAANEASARPGVAQGSIDKVANQLNAPQDANVKLVLQARADEGFFAGDMAWKAVSYLPKEQQPAAAQKYLQDNYGAQMKDVAFATGAKACLYLHGKGDEAGLTAEREASAKRAPVDNQYVGTITG